MSTGPVSRPWRRYLRFSVRGLVVLVLVIGAGLGWLVSSAHIQRDAVAAIVNADVTIVRYDWEWSNGDDIQGGSPWAPRWLVDLIGIDYFGHVTDVECLGSFPVDTVIAQVGRLTRLQRLVLFQSSITSPHLTSHRSWTAASDGTAQSHRAQPRRHVGHRCRFGAFKRLDEPH